MERNTTPTPHPARGQLEKTKLLPLESSGPPGSYPLLNLKSTRSPARSGGGGACGLVQAARCIFVNKKGGLPSLSVRPAAPSPRNSVSVFDA
ncbi:hypothetical protein FVR03_12300 [Pontibacter qinzhouensis]|uniref:Uncharacterized protein n=1 Tax=Pontibacter qinzhouensis TaxID=2603253 RepID=A0A5C8K7E6_9BACT|nr:hypothetical protein [Pontibacter qinzhouensis]TXK45722.1 hypothetical protein FVR03_12300 [Pontibacter qinzhouensis]